MSANSKIEWTETTWNPVTGCTKISTGCKNCYAERMAKRLQAAGVEKYRNGFEATLHPNELERPLRWRKPRMIFVCSMSDLFHDDVPDDFIRSVFEVMQQASLHTFQVLTKRAERMADLLTRPDWPLPPNVWVGVTAENQAMADRRIPHLLRIHRASVRFISAEPLLGPIDLDRACCTFDQYAVGIDWVIVGGESGPGARPMQPEWVRDIRDQCQAAGVPFFFKQWGGTNKKKTGRLLDGRTWDEMPG